MPIAALLAALVLMPPAGAITGVNPSFGHPLGGQIVVITGSGFTAPVRVLFDVGRPLPLEAFVVSLTPTRIEVITPPAGPIGAGQQIAATIVVINEAGTTSESRVTAPDAFVYRQELLLPIVTTVAPSSGPVRGGTRATIFGEGFQAPVLVLFTGRDGSAEAQVLSVTFSEIVVIAPAAADLRLGPNGAADVHVTNVASGTSDVKREAFRYLPNVMIQEATPLFGHAAGGTDVHIFGMGFEPPVAVWIGGVQAQPIRVTGTEILARTLPSPVVSCRGSRGPVRVINVETGEVAEGPEFRYFVQPLFLVEVAPRIAQVGSLVELTVSSSSSGETLAVTLGDEPPIAVTATYPKTRITIPKSIDFPLVTCRVGDVTGFARRPLTVDVRVTNNAGCTDVLKDALTIRPRSTSCIVPLPKP